MPVDRQRYYDRVVQSLRSAVADGRMGLDDVPELIKKVLREQMWRSRRVGQTGEMARFERFIDFVRAKPPEGLGAEVKTLQRLCADHRDALDMLDRAIQSKPGKRRAESVKADNVSVEYQHGNSRQYALRRLRQSRPDLHAKVLSGELTPHRAMQVAGFRPRTIYVPQEPEAAALALARRFNSKQIGRLISALRKLLDENSPAARG